MISTKKAAKRTKRVAKKTSHLGGLNNLTRPNTKTVRQVTKKVKKEIKRN